MSEAEESQSTVTNELVQMPARIFHGPPDDLEITVEDKDGVEGKSVLRQPCKTPQVTEQDGDVMLPSARQMSVADACQLLYVRRG